MEKKASYTQQIGKNVMGSAVKGTYAKNGLDDAVGYYNNLSMGSPSSYLYYTGYYGNVLFESYIYLNGKTVSEAEVDGFAGAILKAITKPTDVSKAKTYVEPQPVTQYVTDALGRTMEVPASLDGGIITIGSTGPLRFASMFGVYDKVIEVDKGDVTDNKNGRAYSYADRYDGLSVDTQTHPDNKLESATVESIAKKNPSLIITSESVWNNYSENFKLLADRFTVVVLKNQQMQYMSEADGSLSDFMVFNIDMLGKIFRMEDRAEELISGIESVIADIASLSGSSDEKVYVAGVTISGSNTLNTTFPIYLPFVLNGVENAYDGGSTENKVVINVEEFARMDIDDFQQLADC